MTTTIIVVTLQLIEKLFDILRDFHKQKYLEKRNGDENDAFIFRFYTADGVRLMFRLVLPQAESATFS